MDLMTEGEGKGLIRDRVHSGKWWVVPWFGETAGLLSEDIEQRYYTGARSAGCQIVMGPVSVSFFDKRWMTAGQLATLMVKIGCPIGAADLARMLAHQDIVVVDDAYERVLDWYEWLTGRVAPPRRVSRPHPN